MYSKNMQTLGFLIRAWDMAFVFNKIKWTHLQFLYHNIIYFHLCVYIIWVHHIYLLCTLSIIHKLLTIYSKNQLYIQLVFNQLNNLFTIVKWWQYIWKWFINWRRYVQWSIYNTPYQFDLQKDKVKWVILTLRLCIITQSIKIKRLALVL